MSLAPEPAAAGPSTERTVAEPTGSDEGQPEHAMPEEKPTMQPAQHRHIRSAAHAAAAAAATGPAAPAPPRRDRLRAWFETLSGPDRLAALACRDEALLAAVLGAAPWCSGRAGAADPEVAPYTSGSIDWDAMVPRVRPPAAAPSEPPSTVPPPAAPSPNLSAPAPHGPGESSSAVADGLPADAYRIRAEPAPPTDPPDAGAAVRALLDHLCVVFPSALRLLSPDAATTTATTTDDRPALADASAMEEEEDDDGARGPLVALHPRLLEALPGEQLLLALDALGSGGGVRPAAPFLSDACMRRATAPEAEEWSAPLSAVLCDRMALAAAAAHAAAATRDATGSSNDDAVPTARRLAALDAHCRTPPPGWVPPTLAELERLFLGPCPEAAFAEAPLATLGLTPLSWLVYHAAHGHEPARRVDWRVLDAGLGKLLHKSREHDVENTPEPPQPELLDGEPPTTAKKKKRTKKNRRAKQRTHSNAESVASCLSTSGDSQPLQSTENTAHTLTKSPASPQPVSNPKSVPSPPICSRVPEPSRDTTQQTEVSSLASVDSEGGSAREIAAPVAPRPQPNSDAVNDASDTEDAVDSSTGPTSATEASDELQSSTTDATTLSVVAAAETSKSTMESGSHNEAAAAEDDDFAWETVEVKSRAGRKKASNTIPVGPRNATFPGFGYGGSDVHSYGYIKKKIHPQSRPLVQKNVKFGRKIVKEILSSILETVDEEVHRRASAAAVRKPTVASPSGGNAWKIGPPPVKPVNVTTTQVSKEPSPEPQKTVPVTLRDVVLGRHATPASHATPVKTWAAAANPQVTSRQPVSPVASFKSMACPLENQKPPSAWKIDKGETPDSASGKALVASKRGKITSADQNTAPTYQETVSASSLTNAAMKSSPTNTEERGSKSETSSGNTDEAAQYLAYGSALPVGPKTGAVPPLPMLLNHDNANSANSSVASSLEAPHSSRHHHHSNTLDVNDVGYHLLDVCDRLSRDMSLFMTRRALALSTRRRERVAILAALQETVSSIWPGSGRAEMYGSCATQTDLPSSDIDVVVAGLDCNTEIMMAGQVTPDISRSGSSSDGLGTSQSFEEVQSQNDDGRHQHLPVQPHPTGASFTSLQMQRKMSSDRVIRLAAELEKKPWAVKVNAIPTASIPVVKVLADPAKLLGGAPVVDMLAHHHHMQASVAANVSDSGSVASHQSTASAQFAQQQSQYNPPWRGADILNGLLSLDITFEGAGHGGIGSTQFSARVIADACQEASVNPDETVLVQTMMVLKELLAQRKLNEPYSGGLSSYAVLLLVLALLQERAVIKAEIERAEKQRRAMSNDAVHTTFAPKSDVEATPKAGPVKTPYVVSRDQKSNNGSVKSNQILHQTGSSTSSVSSWASIARKSTSKEQQILKKPEKMDATAPSYVAAAARPAAPLKPPAPKILSDKAASGIAAQTTKKSVTEPTESVLVSSSSSLGDSPPFLLQGYNDIIEVLCSGPTTAGKLLMHFLLHYGQQFDANTTAIDVSGKHAREHPFSPYYFSPYITRRSAGTIDPVTGMLTVDPIVIYDPLEGAENNNVARRCFAWNSVRWIFAQSYATLSSAVERSATPPSSPALAGAKGNAAPHPDMVGNLMDPSSPLLSCLLSF